MYKMETGDLHVDKRKRSHDEAAPAMMQSYSAPQTPTPRTSFIQLSFKTKTHNLIFCFPISIDSEIEIVELHLRIILVQIQKSRLFTQMRYGKWYNLI
jgi:hypothetical protein